MWLDERLDGASGSETPFLGRVTAVAGGRAEISAVMQLADVKCVSAFGVGAAPQPGEEVLVLPIQGGYVCAGSLAAPAADGTLTLSAPSGARVELRADGSISLNGAVITPEGKLIPAGE